MLNCYGYPAPKPYEECHVVHEVPKIHVRQHGPQLLEGWVALLTHLAIEMGVLGIQCQFISQVAACINETQYVHVYISWILIIMYIGEDIWWRLKNISFSFNLWLKKPIYYLCDSSNEVGQQETRCCGRILGHGSGSSCLTGRHCHIWQCGVLQRSNNIFVSWR